jgi:hypothetical protein
MVAIDSLQSARYEVDSIDDAIELYFERGWTDGLPIVPPTEEKVARFIEAAGRRPDDIVAEYPTRKRTIRVEKLAINAVMAGCKPEYFPVVLAIVDAMMIERFGIHAANASTGSMAVGYVVNGPVRTALGMNCAGNILGPGNRPLSTIGRAIRLIQINVMGSVGGAGDGVWAGGRDVLDRSTIGLPAKYACYHIAENEEEFPTLDPLHVQQGFDREDSVVSAFGAVGSIAISAHESHGAEEIADTIAQYLVHSGKLSNNYCVIIIPPECARYFVGDGWTKADIQRALFERTTRDVAWVKRSGWAQPGSPIEPRGGQVLPGDEDKPVAIAGRPEDIYLVVAGGPAGAFIHAILPYAGKLVSQQIAAKY